jgi:hypothetical protein
LIVINRNVFHAQVSLSQRTFERRQSCRQQRVGFLTLNVNFCPHRPFVHNRVNIQGTQGARAKFHVHFRAMG